MSAVTGRLLDGLREATRRGDVDRATDVLLDELDRGCPAALLVSVLAEAQRQVGEEWQRDEVSVADEHVASAVTEAALSALQVAAPSPEPYRGVLAVVCASGDWHTLPSKMAAATWRWDGWQVVQLGGSLPPDHLRGWLSEQRPEALAVTCSVPMFLSGVRLVVRAAEDAGVPCVAGGRALGHDALRAEALGARWAAAPLDLVEALRGRQPETSPGQDARVTEADQLAALAPELAHAALERLDRMLPAMAQYSATQRASTLDDLVFTLQHLAASVLTGDPRVLTDYLSWLRQVLTSRGVPASAVPMSLGALAKVLPADLEVAATLCAVVPDVPAPRSTVR